MASSSPADILAEVARRGYSVTLGAAPGTLKLRPGGAPPADLLAILTAAKADIVAHLGAVKAGRDRHKAFVDDINSRRPPDVGDANWRTVLAGLYAFLASGHGDVAECLGWPSSELYAVPPVWARIDLCGAALLIGDREVTDITADAIRIKTASGATLNFYRKPQPDYRLVYETRRKALKSLGADEAHFRALDHAVSFCREHSGCNLETAKALVRDAVAKEHPR
jgi:hypothetical protein